MSRIGNQSITIPEGVTVEVKDGGEFFHKQVFVSGSKGELIQSVRKGINIEVKENEVILTRENDLKQTKSYHGLYRSLIDNMIIGVTEGYSKELEIVGIGYRAEQQGNNVSFALGYSHPIVLTPPEGIIVTVKDQTSVKIEGIDKQLVGEIAAKIREFRKPEPYKGKGVRYKGEQIRRKSTKTAVGATE